MTDPQIRIAAEWQCWPTWTTDLAGTLDNPDPHDLVDSALADELVAWADEFDAIFDPQDPGQASFGSEEAEHDFAARGRALSQQVADQLGREVTYRYRGDVVLSPGGRPPDPGRSAKG